MFINRWKNFLIWTLIGLFLGVGFLALFNPQPAQAAVATNVKINLGLYVTTAQADSSGVYAQLNLKWKTTYNPPDFAEWVINIYDITNGGNEHLCLSGLACSIGVPANYPKTENFSTNSENFSSDAGIHWNHTYKVILDLRSGDSGYEAKTTGRVTQSINIGPPPNNGTPTTSGKCAVQGASWAPYGNTANDIILKWTGLPSGCNTKDNPATIAIRRPNGGVLGYQINPSGLAYEDSAAVSGRYIIQTVDSSNKDVGEAFVDVDLSKSNIPGSSSDPNDPSLTQPLDSVTDDTCRVQIGGSWWSNLFTKPLAGILCAILGAIGETGQWLINSIFKTIFDAYQLPASKLAAINLVGTAHAAYDPLSSTSSIRNALAGQDPGAKWVINTWKIVLGLANIFVVIVLLFLAIINILHINYDAYQVKKSLPILIVGIILANFSLFIGRMLVDAVNVLSASFMPTTAGEMLERVIRAVIPPNTGNPSFIPTTTLGTLFIAIFFALFAIIAFLIIGFLFYIRYVVILALSAVAPLAFVLMAFPPTQGVFKQWWTWYSKFIFMKPVSLFLIWLAYQVIQSAASAGGSVGISVWIIAVFLIYAAIVVPFKLGGAVMGAWGGFGKKAAGLAGKGVKFGAKQADYGMQKYKKGKYAGWAPSALYRGYKEGAASKRDQVETLATGKSRKMWAEITTKRSDADVLARRQVGAKQYKEGPGGVNLESRPELGRAFNNAIHNGELPLAENLMLAAAEKYMIGDIIGELDDETKIKLGYTTQDASGRTVPVDIADDLESQREFVRKVSEHNNRFLSQIEDLWQSSGVGTAMSIFGTGFQPLGSSEGDQKKQRDRNIKRFNSPDPMKAIRNFRADSILGADKTITDEGMKYLREGLLNRGHLELMADGYGREATYTKLGTIENIQKLDAEIQKGEPGVEFLQGLRNAIISGRGYPAYTPEHAEQIQVGGQPVDIARLSGDQLQQPEIQAEIGRRAARMSPRDLDALTGNVDASTATPEFKQLISGVANLRKAIGGVKTLEAPGLNKSQSKDAMQNIAQTISQEIGKGMKAGLDPRALIYSTLNAVNPTTGQGLKKAIQEGLAQSSVSVAKIAGQDTSSAKLIDLYKQATQNGTVRNSVDVQRNWVSEMQKKNASPNEIRTGWEFIQAYNGEKPPEESPRGRRGGGRSRRRQEYADME